MRRTFLFTALLASLVCIPSSLLGQGQQADPVAGTWRGTLQATGGTDSPIAMNFVKRGTDYSGWTSGVSESGGEAPFRTVTVNGTAISVDATTDSKLGTVGISAELTVTGNAMKGVGMLSVGTQKVPITLTLQRRPRADVAQHQVEQRPEYFVGRWRYEYTGGEFPPLSGGGRTGTATFTRAGTSSFVTGRVEADLFGKPYQETISIGVNRESKAIVYVERRSDGIELTSVGDWRSPLAIVLETSPFVSGGKTYQLRRAISVLSDTSFNVTEEFSVDGGPFRRLGQAKFLKMP